MATLASAISSAVTKSLLAKLPSETASKFDIDENEYKEFLQSFLSDQLGKATKSGRAAGPKGKNGKGRISGFILFSTTNRDTVRKKNSDMQFTDVGRQLGKMWRELSDNEKAKWNSKAQKQNEENGIPTPTPKNTKKESTGTKVVRDTATKAWVVEGTSFAVKSPKNKEVVGKVKNGKVVSLTASDKKKCEEANLSVAPAPKKKN